MSILVIGATFVDIKGFPEDTYIPKHILADFALTCKGDSMINARIFDGDVVYIRILDKAVAFTSAIR